MIHLKKDHEVEAIRLAGGVSSTVLREVAAFVRPGLSTLEIDQYGGERIRHYGGKSAFLGYRDYPCNICISINEEVVHGLASERRVQFGDIVSLDVGVNYDGYIGDNATTLAVGGCEPVVQRLMEVTKQALSDGLDQALAGNKVVDISRAIQSTAEASGYSVVREFVGHGVGKKVHEDPQIPNFDDGNSRSPILRSGMTLAIEPMVNLGQRQVEMLEDGWTVV
ncbi:MAG: type I methionyl aminopeptidase, partial [Verrucomicrobiota bacterium]|nr:type I methionyl aminopeptidase [Verrucomicrobiota bacterium]